MRHVVIQNTNKCLSITGRTDSSERFDGADESVVFFYLSAVNIVRCLKNTLSLHLKARKSEYRCCISWLRCNHATPKVWRPKMQWPGVGNGIRCRNGEVFLLKYSLAAGPRAEIEVYWVLIPCHGSFDREYRSEVAESLRAHGIYFFSNVKRLGARESCWLETPRLSQ
jgi:hypothetical protein